MLNFQNTFVGWKRDYDFLTNNVCRRARNDKNRAYEKLFRFKFGKFTYSSNVDALRWREAFTKIVLVYLIFAALIEGGQNASKKIRI